LGDFELRLTKASKSIFPI